MVKMGRTELQDAVPMTVGQEFHAFADSLATEIQFLKQAEKSLYSVNMGATAIGTGINVPKGYPEKCAAHLAKLTGKPIVPAGFNGYTENDQGCMAHEETRDPEQASQRSP
jgi:aspartate ammonia-lyase